MTWDWSYAWSVLPALGEGLAITAIATAGGYALALVLGLLWALLRRVRCQPLARGATLLLLFVRSTPLLVQLLVWYNGLAALGVALPALVAGILGLGVHYAAYAAESLRAGIEAVPAGQHDGARALGLGDGARWRLVVLPQALAIAAPALGNQLVAMVKDTPILAAISVVEVLQAARLAGGASFRYVEPITLVGVLFLVLSLALAAAWRRLIPSWRPA